ncbi:hypothetical protein ACFO0N_07780 [Halobium salinum]|uniref:Ig-like domain-containing protein n=1 Tax=Halobium salinum TaxID=1364940 RepID=A0ABD5PBL0_9EURY|nr:hypothetical protein [Halobium salinum]
MHSRRDALHALAVTAGAGALTGLAGCAGDAPAGSGPGSTTASAPTTESTTTHSTDAPAPTTTTSRSATAEPSSPTDLVVTETAPAGAPSPPSGVATGDAPDGPVVASLAVTGPDSRDLLDGNPPHSLWVVNATDRPRDVSFRLSTRGEPVVERTATFPSGGRAFLELRAPASYEVAVESAGNALREAIDESWFDCNRSSSTVAVGPDDVEMESVSTMLECVSVTPDGRIGGR